MIATYNTAVTDTAREILWKECSRKKPWVTRDVLELCDEKRDSKKRWYEEEGAEDYRKANKNIQKALKKAKEVWIDTQSKESDTCLNKSNSKKAYQLVKDITSEKQGRSSTIQDKSGKCLTKEQEILSRWTEYCSELYNFENYGNNTVLETYSSTRTTETSASPVIQVKKRTKAIFNRLKPQTEEIIAEEQAGFRAGEAQQNISTASESCVNISRISTVFSYI